FLHGDTLRLPVRSGAADLCTIAFGIRNVADRGTGLRETRRALRPGGRLLVLEFGLPRTPLLGAAYRCYFTRVLPRLGGLVSGDRAASSYLPRSVSEWPFPEAFQRELEAAGFESCGHRLLSGGIACLHWGTAGVEPGARLGAAGP